MYVLIKMSSSSKTGTELLKTGFAKMVKHGVVMDVTNADQAVIAEQAGAVAVMALERVPADIRAAGGVARMANVEKIQEIMDTVTIPVMAKVRIGHFVEAQILQEIGVDMIDESEVLTPADEGNHVNKKNFQIPFVCGARSLGEALRRISEGAAMIRTKGEAGTGNIVEAVRHMRLINSEIKKIQNMDANELYQEAKNLQAPIELVMEVKKHGRLPVVNFAAGGIATPADAALMMQLGADGNFVGSGIFKSQDPLTMAKAIVEATAHYNDPALLLKASKGLSDAMKGIDIRDIEEKDKLQTRGV
jgi:pyridoxal 5'-phosphate synthase pdxS subunit